MKDGEAWERERQPKAPRESRVGNSVGKGTGAFSEAVIRYTKGVAGMHKCPAHDDAKPSLSVSITGGKALANCKTGCTQQQLADAFKSLGLWPDRTTYKAPETSEWAAKESEYELYRRWRPAFIKLFEAQHGKNRGDVDLVKRYLGSRSINVMPKSAWVHETGEIVFPVVDADGALLGAQCLSVDRVKGGFKKQEVRTYGAVKGGFIPLGEIEAGAPVVVGEGIETTLAAMQLSGVAAGAATMGTAGLAQVRLPRAGRVYVAADNDESGVGLKAGTALVTRLAAEGREAVIVLPEYAGEDWNDVVVKDSDSARALWRKAVDQGTERALAKPPMAVPVEDFMGLAFPKREFLLEPWLPNPGISMLVAPRGEGKTFLAMSVAFAAARGESLLGWPCRRPARVLYVDGELPGAFLQERLKLFGAPPRGTVHIVSREAFMLRQEAMPDIGTAEGREVMDLIIDRVNPDLVILDFTIDAGEDGRGKYG